MKKDTIVKPTHVSRQAKLINLGFVDKPIYAWIEYVGFYKNAAVSYSHIHAIKQTSLSPEQIDTMYYEFEEGRVNPTQFGDFKNYEVIPYPGNGTVKLSDGPREILLFNVINTNDSRQIIQGKEWIMGVPTTEINHNGEKVSSVQTHVLIEKENDEIFLVSLIDDKGMRTLRFKKNGDCLINTKICYLDKQEGRLYFVPINCYLEIMDKSDLSKL